MSYKDIQLHGGGGVVGAPKPHVVPGSTLFSFKDNSISGFVREQMKLSFQTVTAKEILSGIYKKLTQIGVRT